MDTISLNPQFGRGPSTWPRYRKKRKREREREREKKTKKKKKKLAGTM